VSIHLPPQPYKIVHITDFSDKIAMKKVRVTQTYVDSANPVVEEQLEKSGLRLAALLDALWTRLGK
jgi:hypothetical protein